MLKRIPKTTKLLGWHIVIEVVSQAIIDDLCDEKGAPGLWHAMYKDNKFTVYLAKEPPIKEQWKTLWHEMDHAFNDLRDHDEKERE